MKNAMCIKQGDWLVNGSIENSNSPTFGEHVTVSQSAEYDDYWTIAEYPLDSKGNKQSFAKKWFILTSDIDETEIAKQREEYETA